MDRTLTDDLTLAALRTALSRRVVQPGLVHRNDYRDYNAELLQCFPKRVIVHPKKLDVEISGAKSSDCINETSTVCTMGNLAGVTRDGKQVWPFAWFSVENRYDCGRQYETLASCSRIKT